MVELNNTEILALLITKINPEKFKSQDTDTYALWQQALQEASIENKDKLVTKFNEAGIISQPASTPLARPNTLSTSEPDTFDQKTTRPDHKAHDKKITPVLNQAAALCANQQKDAVWLAQLERLAEGGAVRAQYILAGHHHLLGESEPDGLEHKKEAVKWWKKAADQGLKGAQSSLGFYYEKGIGVEKDAKEAVRWYKLAAQQGVADAQFNLGVCYERGEGVEKNLTEAVRLYRLAADQGLPDAQFNLGVCYAEGIGVKKNPTEAVKRYKLAAQQGYALGQFNLGVCYDEGIGVKKNPTEAMRWYQLAAQQGLSDAQAKLESRAYDQKRSIPSVGALAPNLGSPLHQKPPTSPPSLQPGSDASSTSSQSSTTTQIPRKGVS